MLPKITCLCIALLLLQAGFAQQPGKEVMQQFIRMDSVMKRRPWNVLPPAKGKTLPTNQFNHFANVPLRQNAGRNYPKPGKILSVPFAGNAAATCIDTSVRLVYRKDPVGLYNDFITKTSDGNVLVPGFEFDYTANYTAAQLIKCTQQGDTIWSKLIKAGYPNQFVDVYRVFELNDNSLLLAGDVFVPMPVNGGRYDPMLLRVTSTGNLIWEKTFKTKLWDVDTTNGSVDIIDCKQDANGDMYLCGDVRSGSLPRSTIGFKMDLQGNVIWSKGYVTGSFPELTGVAISGNKVIFAGRTVNSYLHEIFNFGISADAATGDTLVTTCFQLLNNDPWNEFYGNNMIQLKNGNLVLFGTGFSDGTTFDGTNVPTHCGMIEFTPDFKFVQSYILKSTFVSNVYNTLFSVFEDGSAAYTWLNFHSAFTGDVIYGSFKNGQIVKERHLPNNGVSVAWGSNFLQADDGGQIVTNLIDDSLAQINAIEFMKLHNSDTSGSCVGRDTAGTFAESQYYYNGNLYFDSIVNNVLTENIRPFDGVYNDGFSIEPNCEQVSFCDTLHLGVSRDTVCENVPVNITVVKNKECGANPFWNYDTTAVSSFYKLNDSTVQVTFDKPWQGLIYGTIDGCQTLEDSVKLTVLVAPAKLDLGPDTSICPGNIIILNAKEGYATYKWQDGSADSTFTITQPGTYYVTTTDACGGIFSDTVVVTTHPPIPFDIGPDISICMNDTTTITAPPGFIHYQWTHYNISNDTDQVVKIFPAMSFMYKVTAEQAQGCFVSDSIYVTVKNVPPVHLGSDTSFCANQSVTLDAGSGFNSYEWNTGDTTEEIVVTHPGTYSVKATLNGCSSSDTMKVLNVYPLPSFSLGKDTALCAGQQLAYNFTFSQATYKWSTGSTLPADTINTPGIYWLQVTQMGCVNSDTIDVKYNPSPVVNLGNDTTLCENQTLLLNAYNNSASYLWQDGSSAQDYLVKNKGIYFVIVTLNNCQASDTISVSYNAFPFFTLGKDSFLCTGEQYVLKPVLNTNVSYIWQDGSSAPTFTVVNAGTYFLTATNECGSFTDSVTITSGFCNIMMPSGFTPNGNGLNDIFRVKYPFPVKDFNMAIYDRWGEKVFETKDINAGWDGTWKGIPLEQNTYVWIISFTDINNKTQQFKGIVTLLR